MKIQPIPITRNNMSLPKKKVEFYLVEPKND